MGTVEEITQLFQTPNTPFALKVLGYLDLESFLSFRLVCKDWRDIWLKNVKKCRHQCAKLQTSTTLHEAAEKGWVLVTETMISQGRVIFERLGSNFFPF